MNLVLAVIFTLQQSTLVSSHLQLSTDLPMLVQKVRPGKIQSIQVVQNQSMRYQYSPEAKIMNELLSDCHIHSAEIKLTSLLQNPTALDQSSRFAFNKLKNTLYEISASKITQYLINWSPHSLTKGDSYLFQTPNCTTNMLQLSEEQQTLIFTCDGVYRIDQKQLQLTLNHEAIYSVFKIIKCQQLILQISSTEGINIYSLDFSLNLRFITKIRHFGNHSLHITDAYYRNNTLFVIDHKKGVFFFSRLADSFKEKDSFRLQNEEQISYRLMTMEYNNIFVALEGNGESTILECLYTENKLILIRYFKGYDIIQKFFIFQNKLLVQSNNKIQMLNINRDPRTISSQHNGYVYNHNNYIQKINYLQNSHFLIVTSNNFEIVHLNTQDTVLECSFPNTGLYSVVIQTPCEQSSKDLFYHVCNQAEKLEITVLSSIKDSYHWLLLIVFGCFVIGIVTLIYWRAEEVLKIRRLFRKIKYFKQKFQAKTEPVELQEVDHAYSDELHARQRNWDELTPQFSQNEDLQKDEKGKRQEEIREDEYSKESCEQEQDAKVSTERGLTT